MTDDSPASHTLAAERLASTAPDEIVLLASEASDDPDADATDATDDADERTPVASDDAAFESDEPDLDAWLYALAADLCPRWYAEDAELETVAEPLESED